MLGKVLGDGTDLRALGREGTRNLYQGSTWEVAQQGQTHAYLRDYCQELPTLQLWGRCWAAAYGKTSLLGIPFSWGPCTGG